VDERPLLIAAPGQFPAAGRIHFLYEKIPSENSFLTAWAQKKVMSALGHKQTFHSRIVMCALPPKEDIRGRGWNAPPKRQQVSGTKFFPFRED
jgi:hypothetical protein